MLQTHPSFPACLKATVLCMCERRGTVLKSIHFWHPETPLQAESHAEAAEEHFYWVCGHLFATRTCSMDGCWQKSSLSFWVTITELGMCINKILVKEEEKDSNSVLSWAALYVHSAKVLLIGVADLCAIVLRMHCDVQNQTASAHLAFPVTSCLSL